MKHDNTMLRQDGNANFLVQVEREDEMYTFSVSWSCSTLTNYRLRSDCPVKVQRCVAFEMAAIQPGQTRLPFEAQVNQKE